VERGLDFVGVDKSDGDVQSSAFDLEGIHGVDGLLGIFFVLKTNKTKSFRSTWKSHKLV